VTLVSSQCSVGERAVIAIAYPTGRYLSIQVLFAHEERRRNSQVSFRPKSNWARWVFREARNTLSLYRSCPAIEARGRSTPEHDAKQGGLPRSLLISPKRFSDLLVANAVISSSNRDVRELTSRGMRGISLMVLPQRSLMRIIAFALF
jgi:hypothetical protein